MKIETENCSRLKLDVTKKPPDMYDKDDRLMDVVALVAKGDL